MRFLLLILVSLGTEAEPVQIEIPATTGARCRDNLKQLVPELERLYPGAPILAECLDLGPAVR